MSFAGGSRSESGLRPAHINPIPEWTTATFEVPPYNACPPGTSTHSPTSTYQEAIQRSKTTRRPLRSSPLAGPALSSERVNLDAVPVDSSPRRTSSSISLKPSSLIPRPLSAYLRSKSSKSLPRAISKAPLHHESPPTSTLSIGPQIPSSLPRPTGRYKPGIEPLQSSPSFSDGLGSPRAANNGIEPTQMQRRRLPRARSAIAVRPIPTMPSLTETETRPRSQTVHISDQTLMHSHPRLFHHPTTGQLRLGERTTMDARLRTSTSVSDVRSASPSAPPSPRLARVDSSSSFASSMNHKTTPTRPNLITRPSGLPHGRPALPHSSTTPPRDNTWYTQHAYAFTPRFSRLGLSAPGVVLPIPAKEFGRRSAAAALKRNGSLKNAATANANFASISEGKPAGPLPATSESVASGKTPDAVCPPKPPSPSSVSNMSMRSTPQVMGDSNSTPPCTDVALDNAVEVPTDDSACTILDEDGLASRLPATVGSDVTSDQPQITNPQSPEWLKFPPQIHHRPHEQHSNPISPYGPTPYVPSMRTRSNTASSTSTTSTLFIARSASFPNSNPALSVASTLTSLSSDIDAQIAKPPPLEDSDADSLRPPTRDTATDIGVNVHLKVLELKPMLSKRKSMLARVKSWRWTSPASMPDTDPTPIPTTPSTPPSQSNQEGEAELISGGVCVPASPSETPAAGCRCPVASDSSSAHQCSEIALASDTCRSSRELESDASTLGLLDSHMTASRSVETPNTPDLTQKGNGEFVNPASVSTSRLESTKTSLSSSKMKDSGARVEVQYLDVEISEPKLVKYKQSGSLRRAWKSLKGSTAAATGRGPPRPTVT